MNANDDYEAPLGDQPGNSAGGFSNVRRGVTPGSFVRGNSGCDVRIISGLDKVIVRKSSTNNKYNRRLKMQVDKQRHCRERNRIQSVRIPRILSETEVGGFYVADMEYVYFHNSVDFFSSASRPALDSVFMAVANFVDEEIQSSKIVEVSMKLFRDKVDEIATAIHFGVGASMFDNSLSRIRCAMDRKNELIIPVGSCHGDLTFSNIMIASDASAIALIDFLDSFIESPLLDIAKLRQDTLFNWTLLMSDHVQDRIRFRQIMGYIDRKLNAKFAEESWYRHNIDLILAINMLRIAPYSQNDKVREFIVTAIESMRFDHD
jgi:hypothetical protein